MTTLLAWEPVAVFAMINAIIAIGLYITTMSGQLSMAHAALAGMGGYVSAVLTTNFGSPFTPALLIAAACGGLVGAMLAFLTVRMKDFVFKLTTLAFGEAVVVVAFNTAYLGGANSFTGIPLYTDLTKVALVTAIVVYVAWRFDGSRLGFAARSVRDDALAASANGVSVRGIRMMTFGLGGAIAALGGAVQAHYVLIVNPSELGFLNSLTYVIFLLVGGSYVLWGPLLGAVVLTLLPEALRFANEYRLILYGLVIVIVVLCRPEGILIRRPAGKQWRRVLQAIRGHHATRSRSRT